MGGGITSTLEDLEADIIAQCWARSCAQKFIVITGCSIGGLGFETARVLAKYGAEVVVCCRTQEACDLAVEELRSFVAPHMIHGFVLNLASFRSIQQCAESILALNRPIHILINNAATKEVSVQVTEDGFELQWQVNYLGPFYFTNLLLPMLVQGGMTSHDGRSARVVNLSSIMQYVYCSDKGLNFEHLLQAVEPTCDSNCGSGSGGSDINDEDTTQRIRSGSSLSPSASSSKGKRSSIGSKNALRWYADSKLAVILWSKELSRLMNNSDEPDNAPPVIAMSVHPGISPSTNAYRSMTYTALAQTVGLVMVKIRSTVFLTEKHKSIPLAAATTVYCALNGRVVAGEYYADCKISDLVNDSVKNDPEAGKKLWEVSMQQIDYRLQCIMAEDLALRQGTS